MLDGDWLQGQDRVRRPRVAVVLPPDAPRVDEAGPSDLLVQWSVSMSGDEDVDACALGQLFQPPLRCVRIDVLVHRVRAAMDHEYLLARHLEADRARELLEVRPRIGREPAIGPSLGVP